ncbi:MAG: DMT family transporter [Ignavibacteriales bacterium]
MDTEKIKIALGYAAICLIWGSTWMVIRIGLDSLTPILSAGLRFFLASIILYGFMKYKNVKMQTDRTSIILYIILGIFSFVFPFGLVYWGENYIPSWLASILFAVMPFFVVIISRIAIPSEKIYGDRIAGLMLGFLGIIIIFSKNMSWDLNFSFWGMFAVVLSALLQGCIAVIVKKYGSHLHPLSMNFVPVLMAGIVLTGIGLISEDHTTLKFDAKAVISIIYLAVFGTIITFTTYYWLLKRINIILLSLSSFVTPIVAVILGWLFMGEVLSGRDLFGSSLVLIGILFANFNGLKSYYLTVRSRNQ